mmetsp:Transcript_17015/g.18444  ORF Transcript_17015/g.18444 Transcript_17015/m.18444 type:complete len:83 (+) Transcript_17015:157-405(+)
MTIHSSRRLTVCVSLTLNLIISSTLLSSSFLLHFDISPLVSCFYHLFLLVSLVFSPHHIPLNDSNSSLRHLLVLSLVIKFVT